MALRRISLRIKLVALLGAFFLFLGTILTLELITSARVANRVGAIKDHLFPNHTQTLQLDLHYRQLAELLDRACDTGNTALFDETDPMCGEVLGLLSEIDTELSRLEQDRVNRIQQRFLLYYEAASALATSRGGNGPVESLESRADDVDRLRQEVGLRIEALLHHQQSVMAQSLSETEGTVWEQSRRSTLIAIAAAMFLFPVFTIAGRKILRPIGTLSALSGKIAKGDLDQQIDRSGFSDDELGDLAASFDAMTKGLREKTVSKDFLDNIIDSMADLMLVIRPDGKIVSANRAAHELLGYGDDLSNMSVAPVLTGESSDGDCTALARTLVGTGEKALFTADGKIVPVSFSGSSMERNGEDVGIVFLARDISDLRQAAWERETIHIVSEFLLSDPELESIYAELPRILSERTMFPRVALELLDEESGELKPVGSSIVGQGRSADGPQSITPQISRKVAVSRRPVIEADVGSAGAGVSGIVCVPLKIGDGVLGTLTFADMMSHACDQNRIGTIHAIADLLAQTIGRLCATQELKRSAEELAIKNEEVSAARDEALAISKLKSEFLANMSHEIRTPMNGVLGMTTILLETDLEGEQREFAETILNSGESLLTIINDILDFSKVEAGMLVIEQAPFDLCKAIEEMTEILAPRATERGIELALRIAPDVPHHYLGDAGRIRQILTNLISNAIKFTHEGRVVVEIDLAGEPEETVELRFSVEDTGIGIPPDRIDAVFEQFQQADGSTTRKYGGTGLGLSISRQLVNLMGGEIGLDSTVDKGSTFWFRLPLKLDPNSPVIEERADLTGIRVLCVDDNPVNRRVFREQLSKWGIRSTIVESAAEALEELILAESAGDPYVFALIDHLMPEVDGEQLGKWIKEDPRLASTMMLVLTSAGMRTDAQRLLEIGFAAYLIKPVAQSKLYGALAGLAAAASLEGGLGTEEQPRRRLPKFEATVLVAEDNPVNQKVATRLFQGIGCHVDIAVNGIEALASLAGKPYDMVFMDCQMPEMDGYSATARVRRSGESWADVPIIAMTANAMAGDRERCLAAGMDDYVSKPVKASTIAIAIEKWLSKRSDKVVPERAGVGSTESSSRDA